MARLSLALLASVALTAFACGAEQDDIGREQEIGRERIKVTPVSRECPPDWPGPWTACPEAEWIQQLANHTGYRITGETGSALIAQGNGSSFYIWATEGTPKQVSRAAKREKWQPLGTVDGVEVYGDERLWRWWVVAEEFVVWLQAGPHMDSQLPSLEEMDSLVRASETVPPPR
jgi:hypothetical protein